jgi:hypothetical protein
MLFGANLTQSWLPTNSQLPSFHLKLPFVSVGYDLIRPALKAFLIIQTGIA